MRGFSTTRPSKIFKDIPVYLGDWNKEGAGYGQIDTVVHSGPRLEGVMAYTVNFVDVATYWQEPVMQLNKGELVTKKSLQAIKAGVLFPIKGLYPDSGSEFINCNLKKWCDNNHIQYTGSRPSKKNDNCYIEQRNDVVVHKYVGYERYDCEVAVTAMNELYSVIRLYINYFQLSFKLISKTKLQHGKWKCTYNASAIPYQRVLARKDISESAKIHGIMLHYFSWRDTLFMRQSLSCNWLIFNYYFTRELVSFLVRIMQQSRKRGVEFGMRL